MKNKDVRVTVDFEELEKQLKQQRENENPKTTETLNVRSTVFSLGKDPRVTSKQKETAPDLRELELLKDGIGNPYVQLNWRVSRFDVDSAGVLSFNIYRRKVSEDNSLVGKFSRIAFDRLSRNIIRKGKFANDRKALHQIKKSLIPSDLLNVNLNELETSSRARTGFNIRQSKSKFASKFQGQDPVSTRSEFERTFQDRKFKKIGQVNYTKFLAQEKKKFVSVREREFVDLNFKDKQPGYGESYEYYVVSVLKDGRESSRSNSIKILIRDLSSISSPESLTVSQVNENKVILKICLNKSDDVARIILFRKSEDEISFKRMLSVQNVSDCISLADTSIQYGKSYAYRVVAENIHGSLSEPKEVSFISTVQKITPQSRSNNLRIPVLSAVQDQNSDFIKITMSSNDPRVRYYRLERKDLTIHERRYSAPSKLTTNFGGNGWETNTFFVDRERKNISDEIKKNKDVLNKTVKEQEVIFVDNLVESNHIYKYRVRGFDLFGNATSYQFATARAVGKKSIRSPVNLRFEVLRGSPFRIKILWDDDNSFTEFLDEDLFNGDDIVLREPSKVIYKIQRRRRTELTYQTFPSTSNNYMVDEVSTPDFIEFSAKKKQDTFEKVDNLEITDIGQNFSRPFNIPEFLLENDIYYYRVAAISENGEESNFTEEISVSTLPEISDPVRFKAEAKNTRVSPLVAKLSWELEKKKSKPDHWIIERKFDVPNDSFEVIGNAYVSEEFFDRNLQRSNTYVYRIKGIDLLGRESLQKVAKLTV